MTRGELPDLQKPAEDVDAALRQAWMSALRWLLVCLLGSVVIQLIIMAAISLFAPPATAQTVPAAAQRYEGLLKRNAQMLWGLHAPVAVFAAQIHQESRWRADAQSPVGAQGLAQFMPTTANWIGGLYADLADRTPRNPTWAIRALVSYDRWLWDRISADDACQRMAYTLSAYNGGLGWVYKRQRLSATPGVCLGATCQINPGVSAASQRENSHYPVVIIQQHQPLYAHWGPGVCQ